MKPSTIATIALALAPLPFATLGGCGTKAPDVDVSTYVGPAYARADAQARQDHALTVARALAEDLAANAPAEPTTPADHAIAPVPVSPPTNAVELAELLAAIETVPIDELGGPARRVAAASPETWPQIRAALLAERKAPKGDYRSLLDAIGGDVPNRYGHFARAWKKAHGFSVKLSQDWFEDLLMLPPGRISSGLRPVYRDCVAQTALLRAASKIAKDEPTLTGDIVATLLDTAYIHTGTFRDEVGRALTGIGDEAIAHLLVQSQLPEKVRDETAVPVRRAQYATHQLDRMDRLHPARATDAVREDPRRLAMVLNAYGTVRPGEAADVLLDYVDAGNPTIRAAARASFAAFVTGPPPAASHRKIRLLGGATTNARSHLTYRQRAALAVRQRLAMDAPELVEEECDTRREDGSFDLQCEAQPDRHAQAYFTWLDERRQTRDQEALADALAETDVQLRVNRLDRLLVGNPELSVGPKLVPVYCEAADAARDEGNMARAGQLLRKAARLADRISPEHGQELRVQALLAEAEVPGLTPAGQRMLLASARSILPDDPRVDAALAQVQHRALDEGNASSYERWAPAMGMVFGLWGLGLMGSWWRRRRDQSGAASSDK